ncbi:MAG: hypothetical protein RLZZ28_1232 [Bacteroidota bacterium]|jgi:multidrug efflux pump subunit AcrA (membrane-fusion protein)
MKYFLLSTCILISVFACKKKQETTLPQIENITESVYASGSVKSDNQYQVFSSVNGIIKKIFVTEGVAVNKETPLLSIENTSSQLSNANAQLQADYNSVKTNLGKLNEQKINIDLAKAKMDNDALLLERQKNLWKQDIGTRNELDQRELNFKSSTAAYEAAKIRYDELKKQLQFLEEQSKKNLQISNTLAGDFIIRSVKPGKVYSILKKEGEMVNTQTPVAIVGDANNFYIELQVDEYDIARIAAGQKTILSMDSYKGQVFEARIRKLNPLMNERSRTFTVDADFISMPPTIFPNLTVEANIIIRSKEKVLTIPRNYLSDDGYVWISATEKKKVTVGLKDYQKAEITSGLTASDIIYKPAQ